MIAFSFGYQIFLFGNIPTEYQVIGASLVTMGCLLPVAEEIYYYYHSTQYSPVHMIDSMDDKDTEDEDRGYPIEM